MKRFLFAILLAAVSIVANAQFCDQAQPGPGFPSNPTCEAAICAADPFCCSTSWDNLCASAAAVSPSCVGCLSTGGGYVGPPYCDQAQAGPGFPGVPACQTAICAADPFCCNTSWDALCASAAATNPSCVSCLTPLVGGATLVPLAGNNSVPCGTNTQLQDHAGLANYANGANGFTVLQNSGAAVITISGNYNVETNWDFINVFSGAGTGGTLIQTLTGTGTYNFTSAPGQIITVQFTSDGSIVAPGFDFAITYTGSCVASIPNDEIAGAIPVACGASVSGTTSGATQGVDENLLCGTSVSAPGVWYSVVGNGLPVTVSTCLGASYDTKLNVYTGSSGSLTCIGGNDDFCGLQSSVTFNTTNGTTYWILVQGFGGATGTFTLDVACTTLPACDTPVISAGGPTSFCPGGSVNLTATVPPIPGSVTVTISGTGFLDETSWDFRDAANTVISSGGGYATGSTNVLTFATSNGPFTFNLETQGSFNDNVANYTVVCNTTGATLTSGTLGGGQTFSAPNLSCGGNYNLTWSPALGLSTTTGPNTTATPGTTTLYTVTATSPSGNCTASSANILVTVFPTPSAPIISASGPTTFCAGGSVTLTSNYASGNLWSTGETTQSIMVSTSQSVTVTHTDGNGCTSNPSAATAVTVNPLPSAPSITASGPTTFCLGGSVTLTSSYATGNLWSNGATTQSITVSTNGTFTVIHTDANTCTSPASAATVVTVNPNPTAPVVTTSGPTTFCSGGSVTLTSSYATGNLWSTGETTQSITVTTGGSYTVAHTNANGCTSVQSANVLVIVNPTPAPPIISASGPISFCDGGSVTLTSNYTTGNLWSTGATTQSITVTTGGNYTVSHTNINGCTSSTSSIAINVNPLPAAPTVTTSGPTTFCAGGSITLTSSYASGNLWSNGQTTQSITVNTSGNYTVTHTNAQGCTSVNSSGTLVTVNPIPAAPIITTSGPTAFCIGDSVTLTSNYATGNVWSTGATTQSITVSVAGTYTVIHTDANGCTSPSSGAVVVATSPFPSQPVITTSGPTTFCAPGSVTLTSNFANGNLWSNGATTQSITVTTSGTYTVVVTTASGCVSLVSEPVVVDASQTPPTPIVTVSGPTNFCQGGSVTLTSSSQTGNVWSNGATSQSIVVTTAGNYSVFVTNAAGCSGNSSNPAVVVTIDTAPNASFTVSGSSPTFTFNNTSTGGNTYTWDFGDGSPASNAFSPTHTYNQAGSFIVTLTVSNDCGEDKAYFTVIIPNTGIGENGLNEVVNLFPNPAETWITLTYVPAGEKEVTMKVYDIQGKIVMNEFLGKVFTEYSKSFDVISLAPGMYNVTLESNEGIIAVRRFIKK